MAERTLVYLPMYIGFYIYNSQEYSVAVHGQSGRCAGERPYGMGSTWTYMQTVGQKGYDAFDNWKRG